MLRTTLFIFCLAIASVSVGCELPEQQQRDEAAADPFSLDSVKWQNRVILLFAKSPRDPAYARQQELLAQARDGLESRQILVVTAFADGTGMRDGRPIDQRSVRALRRDFQPRANAFTFVLVGKDGTEKIRETGRPPDPEAVFDTIDTMPMRQQEMKDQSGSDTAGR